MKVCEQCETISGELVVNGAMVTCHRRVHLENEFEEANDRIAELAQANSALRENNAQLVNQADESLRLLARRNTHLGELEHFVVSQGLVEKFGTWRRRFQTESDLSGLAAREAGVAAAEKYLAKNEKRRKLVLVKTKVAE